MKITISVDVPDLHKRAIAAREARGLSQQELAAIAGVSVQTVQYLEQGRRGLSERTLRLLCKGYKLSPKKFLEGVDIPKGSSYYE